MQVGRTILGPVAAALALCLLAACAAQAQDSGAAQDDDRHAGYYYPTPGSHEVYQARSRTLDESGRPLRIGFVTGLSASMAQRAYAPPYAIFAKGSEAEKLIIVALDDGSLDTIYRARATLADLTALARTLPIFREFGVQEFFTFFDLMKMMGFRQLTVTNGRDFAHQVAIE